MLISKKKKAEDYCIFTNVLKSRWDLKMSTISKKLSILKSFLVLEEYIKRDPTTKLKAPKEALMITERKPYSRLSNEDTKRNRYYRSKGRFKRQRKSPCFKSYFCNITIK